MTKILIIGIVLGLTACATPVHITSRNFDRSYTPVDSKTFSTESSHLKMEYAPETADSTVLVTFTNISNKPLRIVWDETAFINHKGESERVIHEGVKLVDRDKAMPPSMIPPGAILREAIGPSSRVSWEYSSWNHEPICGATTYRARDFGPADSMFVDDECLGKTFGLFITYDVDGKKHNLTAKFRYADRKPKLGSM